MCWEHEHEYSKELCFDFLWNDYDLFDDSIVRSLEAFGVRFRDHKGESIAKGMFFKLLSEWHDAGIIMPKNA